LNKIRAECVGYPTEHSVRIDTNPITTISKLMKRLLALPSALLIALSALTVAVAPVSTAHAGPYYKEAKYRAGFSDGYDGGYRYGFFDGRKGNRYRVKIDQGRGPYLRGYADGYYKGYANGYHDGQRRQKYYVPVIRW